jgi:hypothetical protein
MRFKWRPPSNNGMHPTRDATPLMLINLAGDAGRYVASFFEKRNRHESCSWRLAAVVLATNS